METQTIVIVNSNKINGKLKQTKTVHSADWHSYPFYVLGPKYCDTFHFTEAPYVFLQILNVHEYSWHLEQNRAFILMC